MKSSTNNKKMRKINHTYKKIALYGVLTAFLGPIAESQVHANEGQPKLFEPYAPKPSGKSPESWEIKILEGSQVENSTTLTSGKDIKVTVPAYEMVPKVSPDSVVLKDPGFDPALGTTQKATIGAILTEYSEVTVDLHGRLEKVTKELEKALGVSSPTPSSEEAEGPEAGDKGKKEPNNPAQTKANEAKKSNSSSR
jgi:hypothetical protein